MARWESGLYNNVKQAWWRWMVYDATISKAWIRRSF
jgi:hypothetical protein